MARTVLIVEDADAFAATLEIALGTIPDVEVRISASAREALGLLGTDGGIAALVTDLQLPYMDGFELIERVRAQPCYASLPIIVVSGDTDPRTPERLRRLGANAHFLKPYSPAEVRRTLQRLLDAN
jgi:CheY-like chemotaxis protein